MRTILTAALAGTIMFATPAVAQTASDEASFNSGVTLVNGGSPGPIQILNSFNVTNPIDPTTVLPIDLRSYTLGITNMGGLGGIGVNSGGAGVLALTGTNLFAGGLIVSSSTVTIDGGAALGTGIVNLNAATLKLTNDVTISNPILLTSFGATFDTAGFDATVSGQIYGPSPLFLIGGLLTLTSSNTYAGGTTIFAGTTLQVGNGGVAGTLGTGNVVDNGSLVFNRSNDLTVANIITGAGTVMQAGSGTTILTGANTYAGTTTISAGTLQIGDGGTTGTLGSGNVVNNGSLVFNRSNDLTVANVVSGTGELHKTGTGGLVLTGANSYTGGTTVNGGWLYADGTGTLGTGPVNVTNGYLQLQNGFDASGMVFSTANGYTFFTGSSRAGTAVLTANAGGVTSFQDGSNAGSSVAITKSGGLTEFWGWSTAGNARLVNNAGGVVDFSGSAGPAFDGKLTAGSIEGDGTFRLGANALTVGANGLSTTVGGAIQDGGAGGGTGGSIIKTGAGTLTLSGTSTYTGPTTVESGRLVVSGSLVSPVTVEGGTLSGAGTVGGLSVLSGGTVAPGNGIGTLSVNGNVTFAPGSAYALEIDGAGRSDRIAAMGTATLSGGTVKILPDQGINFVENSPYTILTAQGGVTGRFAATQSAAFAFITPTLDYAPDAVTLTMVRKSDPTPPTPPTTPTPPVPAPLAFHSVAVSGNQYRTADAVEALAAGNRIYNTVLGSSVAGARQAFDALSGEAHASTVTVAYQDSRLVREAILTRLREPLTSPALPLLAHGSYSAAFAADRPGKAPRPVVVLPHSLPQRDALWGEGFGSWGTVRSNGNAAALDSSTGGFILGADALVQDGLRLGLAGGYTSTSLDVDRRLSSGTVESVFGAIYGSGSWGPMTLRLGGVYAHQDFDVSRTIRFPGYADATRSSSDGSSLQAFGELGYRVALGAVALEPFAGASVLRLQTDRFQEEGGAAALTGFGRTYELGTTTLGVRAEARLSPDMPLTLKGLLGWRHAYGDVNPEALVAFAGGVNPFNIAGVPVDRDALVVEAGLTWQASEAIRLGVNYSGQIGQRAQDHALKGNFIWTFETR